jgi:hypothetical protein
MCSFLPVQVDPTVGLIFVIDQYAAIDCVHDNALAAVGDADDAFAGDRLAELGAAMELVSFQPDNSAARFNFKANGLGKLGVDC